jgi:hypothetical protein
MTKIGRIEGKKKLFLAIIVFIGLLLVSFSIYSAVVPAASKANTPNQVGTDVPFMPCLGSGGYPNGTVDGARGYVLITLAPGAPKQLDASAGTTEEKLLLQFVSYTPELPQVTVSFDPNSSLADHVGVGNGGSVTDLNQFISYQPSGSVTIKNGETITVKMIIKIPAYILSNQGLYLDAPGITVEPNVPIVDQTDLMVNG